MIALQVLDIKLFMKQLLIGHNFDRFNISEGTITTFCTFSIDGAWQRDFLDPDHENVLLDREYTPWKNVREFCFSLIKGKRTPIAFKFVFMLPEEVQPVPPQIKTLRSIFEFSFQFIDSNFVCDQSAYLSRMPLSWSFVSFP